MDNRHSPYPEFLPDLGVGSPEVEASAGSVVRRARARESRRSMASRTSCISVRIASRQ